MKPRHRLLGAVLVATLVATFWPQPGEIDGSEVVAARPATIKPAETGTALAEPQSSPTARFALEMTQDLFPQQSWAPPPPPPPKPAPPPPPEAPPLPFKFLGRWVESGTEYVFLTQGTRVIRVSGGESLPGGWVVDAIDASAVHFTYTPLNKQKTLGISP